MVCDDYYEQIFDLGNQNIEDNHKITSVARALFLTSKKKISWMCVRACIQVVEELQKDGIVKRLLFLCPDSKETWACG